MAAEYELRITMRAAEDHGEPQVVSSVVVPSQDPEETEAWEEIVAGYASRVTSLEEQVKGLNAQLQQVQQQKDELQQQLLQSQQDLQQSPQVQQSPPAGESPVEEKPIKIPLPFSTSSSARHATRVGPPPEDPKAVATEQTAPAGEVVPSDAALLDEAPADSALSHPELSNPAVSNPAVSNPAISNPAISNPAVAAQETLQLDSEISDSELMDSVQNPEMLVWSDQLGEEMAATEPTRPQLTRPLPPAQPQLAQAQPQLAQPQTAQPVASPPAVPSTPSPVPSTAGQATAVTRAASGPKKHMPLAADPTGAELATAMSPANRVVSKMKKMIGMREPVSVLDDDDLGGVSPVADEMSDMRFQLPQPWYKKFFKGNQISF